jgi:hypothetical protein
LLKPWGHDFERLCFVYAYRLKNEPGKIGMLVARKSHYSSIIGKNGINGTPETG